MTGFGEGGIAGPRISDSEVVELSRRLLDEHGDAALDRAAEQALELTERGDFERAGRWWKVVLAIAGVSLPGRGSNP